MTTSSSDHTNVDKDDLHDEIIRQKFQQLLAQESVPDELTQNILKLASEHSIQNKDTNLNNQNDLIQQNMISFPKTHHSHVSSDDSSDNLISKSSTFSSYRPWLSIAAGITAISLMAIIFYQQKQHSNEPIPIAQQEPPILKSNPPALPPHQNNDVHNTHNSNSEFIAQTDILPPVAENNSTSHIPPEKPDVSRSVIVQRETKLKPSPSTSFESSPNAHFPELFQANEQLEDNLPDQEFNDIYPAFEPVENETETPTVKIPH